MTPNNHNIQEKLSYRFLGIIGMLILPFPTETRKVEANLSSLEENSNSDSFPDTFKFGVSTAAYQIEGGWNSDGRGPSIWDTFTHQHPEMIDDHSNGDVGPDSYHLFRKDLDALKQLKVDYYRFSISWSRILPTGDMTVRNAAGIQYYNGLINELLANHIEPLITMYHYDLPEALNLFGGFTNHLIVRYFRDYARVLFESFGDRVRHWITFNEPFEYCIHGYGEGNYPPMGQAAGVADYLCMDNTLKAHALVYRLYEQKYKPQQKGKVGITISSRFYYTKPGNDSLIDRAIEYELGWLATPIFGNTGNYPACMLKDIAENSRQEGRERSRLEGLSANWQKVVAHSADFLGLNYYTARLVQERAHGGETVKKPSWEYDSRLSFSVEAQWKRAKSEWLYQVPQGLKDILNWIRNHYNNVEVFITENGWSDEGQLADYERISYLKAHLMAVLEAIREGCLVTRYTHWSLIDNFEWQRGYTEKFGLFAVNVTSVNKERVAKESARYYRAVVETRKIPS